MEEEKLNLIKNLIANGPVYSSLEDITQENWIYIYYGNNKFSSIDVYCPYCKKNKTLVNKDFKQKDDFGSFCLSNAVFYNNMIYIIYECPTCHNVFEYEILFSQDKIIKISQYPSLYDVRRDILNKYQKNKLLTDEYLQEFKKAHICANEGYFVASFTYLRRVLEEVIYKIYNENKTEIGIELSEFSNEKLEDKVKYLKKYLPFEKEIYTHLYKLLSEGIHYGKKDEECKEDYEILKECLIDILEEYQRQKEREKRHQELHRIVSMKKGENNERKNEG